VRTQGQTLMRLDRAGRPDPVGPPSRRALRVLAGAGAVLVADYGRGMTADATLRAALARAARRVALVWDPHPSGSEAVPGARLVTPNRSELVRLRPQVLQPPRPAPSEQRSSTRGARRYGLPPPQEYGLPPPQEVEARHRYLTAALANGDGLAPLALQARALATRWRAEAVAVTLAEHGALLVGADGQQLLVPARPVRGSDPCGAGDRFASAATGLLADGAAAAEAVTGAVRAASGFVADGGAASLEVARGALVLPYRASRRKEVVPGDSG
jgi:D-beta-D-heptose 7-phosphate kinase / D-beta-D-heptose 1-phosphate adenosyltransferase